MNIKAIRPKCGFYFTEADLLNAKKNIENFPWAKQTYEKLIQQCEEILEYSDKRLYNCVLGMKDQTFAYGISGCPNCQRPFPINPDEQRSMFSKITALPVKRLTCPHCAMIFPNEQFQDFGEGFELSDKGYYPIGMWNFFIGGELLGGVRDHEGLVTKLTYLYMITGNGNYAHKALVILDAFSAIFADSVGPRDFTPFGSDFIIGRLHLLTSIVHRVKICLAQDYDWLYDREELDQPSPALNRLGKYGTMRQNIEAMLNDYMLSEQGGPIYDLKDGNLTNLQNHESDGVRAMLAVGIVLENKDYCRWGIQAVEAYFYNAIGRDGMYYEGSYGYSLFTGTIFLDIALLSVRASANQDFESFHPFESERFFRYAIQNPTGMLCQGHLPCYGDWGRDSSVGTEPNKKVVTEVYRAALYFYQFSQNDSMKEKARECMLKLYPLVADQLGVRGIDIFFLHPIIEGNLSTSSTEFLSKGSTIMGQAGIGILRDRNDTTILMRVGANHTHVHDDVLAYNYYAYGKEISADLGYSIYGTNSHYGWLSKSIAHNTVVVNQDETMIARQLYKPFSGGEFTFVYESENVSAFEGKAPELYGINAYQRMLGVVPITCQASYVVDFFYVDGVKTADYAYHAFHEESQLQLIGAHTIPSSTWTLAGVGTETKPYFDYPGKSFGERLTTGETFSEFLEGESGQGWTLDKNNGYGFIYDLHEYKLQGNGSSKQFINAQWSSEQGIELNLFGICNESDRLFTGVCPSVEGTFKHPILIVRSEQPIKQFASVIQTINPQSKEATVSCIEKLPVQGKQVTSIQVQLSTTEIDFWAYSPQSQEMVVTTPFGEWVIHGNCGWIRVDHSGNILANACVKSSYMRYQGTQIQGTVEEWYSIVDLDEQNKTIWIKSELPDSLPKFIRVCEPTGNRPSTLYPVFSIEKEGDRLKVVLGDSIILSKGIVKGSDMNSIDSFYPLPLGFDNPQTSSPFKEKRMKGEKGGLAIIKEILDLKRILIDPIHPFEIGEKFIIYDVEKENKIQWIY